jgi:predicted RNA-binding protein with PIN domain
VNYFLDGYNILFTLTESDHPFATQRQKIIRFLQKRFALFKMNGILVFDGKVRRDEESGRSYRSPLDIIYTPKGQSADQYIVERIESSENPRQITVVTNDRALVANARSLGAKTTPNAEFIQWLLSRKKKTAGPVKPDAADTRQNIDRLLALFEKRLKEDGDQYT